MSWTNPNFFSTIFVLSWHCSASLVPNPIRRLAQGVTDPMAFRWGPWDLGGPWDLAEWKKKPVDGLFYVIPVGDVIKLYYLDT